MDGHTFVQLKSFSAESISSWCNAFPKRVDMPICTHISYDTGLAHSLEFLPIFQAAFHFPLMHEWTLQGCFYRTSDVRALSKIRARVLRLFCTTDTPRLLMAIESRYELEELSIELHGLCMARGVLIALTEVRMDYSLKRTTHPLFDPQSIPKLEDAINHPCNQSEGKMICPNLKVLGLHCRTTGGKQRDEVRRWCVEMMEGRRRAGFPLDRCCIWWGDYSAIWGKEPSLVLFTSNEG